MPGWECLATAGKVLLPQVTAPPVAYLIAADSRFFTSCMNQKEDCRYEVRCLVALFVMRLDTWHDT